MRKNIDLKEQEGKPNCNDIKINLQKCLCLQSNPENVCLLRKGLIFFINLSKSLPLKCWTHSLLMEYNKLVFSVCYTCTIYSGYNDSRKA